MALQLMPLSRKPTPFDHPEWIFELKYDGFGSLARTVVASSCRWPEDVYIGVGSLRRQGFGNPRLLVVQQPGAAHNEEAWAHRFPRALQFRYNRPTDQ
jgi:hypothetical protein